MVLWPPPSRACQWRIYATALQPRCGTTLCAVSAARAYTRRHRGGAPSVSHRSPPRQNHHCAHSFRRMPVARAKCGGKHGQPHLRCCASAIDFRAHHKPVAVALFSAGLTDQATFRIMPRVIINFMNRTARTTQNPYADSAWRFYFCFYFSTDSGVVRLEA